MPASASSAEVLVDPCGDVAVDLFALRLDLDRMVEPVVDLDRAVDGHLRGKGNRTTRIVDLVGAAV